MHIERGGHMENAYIYHTDIGRILISEDGIGITGVTLLRPEETSENEKQRMITYNICETELLKTAHLQFKEYLEGNRKNFDVRLHPSGTQFQRKVWEALLTIPYGETRSYLQIASAVGNEKAARAVGMANHRNPIICIIPCHRVIGANGCLVGYGAGLDIKEQLLNLEKERKDSFGL